MLKYVDKWSLFISTLSPEASQCDRSIWMAVRSERLVSMICFCPLAGCQLRLKRVAALFLLYPSRLLYSSSSHGSLSGRLNLKKTKVWVYVRKLRFEIHPFQKFKVPHSWTKPSHMMNSVFNFHTNVSVYFLVNNNFVYIYIFFSFINIHKHWIF